MNTVDFFHFTREALWLVLSLSAPPIIVAVVVGLVIAIVQAATQVQEQSVQYAAKFFAIVLTLFLMASLLGGALLEYTNGVMEQFPALVKH